MHWCNLGSSSAFNHQAFAQLDQLSPSGNRLEVSGVREVKQFLWQGYGHSYC
ncbi:hypothetical protein TSMEX_009603 [Taenia solium]|eukprot:TsM_000434200 transcript=TsM_000434200 gene=TsM_000434200